VRARFEPLLGHDFSQVRVQPDMPLPEHLPAAAVTLGNDVAFAPGRYAPETPRGKRLLAHELTHVVQHAGTHSTAPAGVGKREDPSEREAESAADALATGRPVSISAPPSAAVAPGFLDWVEDTASGAWDAVSGVAEGAVDFAEDVGSTVYSGMKAGAGYIREGVGYAKEGITWAEDEVASGAHWLEDKAEGIPGLEQLAWLGGHAVEGFTDMTGGLAKAGLGLVGGLGEMTVDPVDTAIGLEKLSENIPIIGYAPKAVHALASNVFGDGSNEDLMRALNPITSTKDSLSFMGNVGKGFMGQYAPAIEGGHPIDAAYNFAGDIFGFIASGGETAAAKAGEISKLADAGKMGELADAGKAAELANAGKGAAAGELAEGGKLAETAKPATLGEGISKNLEQIASEGGGHTPPPTPPPPGGGHALPPTPAAPGGGGAVPGRQILDPWPKDMGPQPPLKPNQVRMELPKSGLTPGTERAIAEGVKPGELPTSVNKVGSKADKSFANLADDATKADQTFAVNKKIRANAARKELREDIVDRLGEQRARGEASEEFQDLADETTLEQAEGLAEGSMGFKEAEAQGSHEEASLSEDALAGGRARGERAHRRGIHGNQFTKPSEFQPVDPNYDIHEPFVEQSGKPGTPPESRAEMDRAVPAGAAETWAGGGESAFLDVIELMRNPDKLAEALEEALNGGGPPGKGRGGPRLSAEEQAARENKALDAANAREYQGTPGKKVGGKEVGPKQAPRWMGRADDASRARVDAEWAAMQEWLEKMGLAKKK
jgi:hypothetical protein